MAMADRIYAAGSAYTTINSTRFVGTELSVPDGLAKTAGSTATP